MNNQVLNILNKSASPSKAKYNILTFDTHERYQSQLAKTGHNFYAFKYEGCKDWVETYAQKPDNYYTLPTRTLYSGIDFDFILSQSKFGQIQRAYELSQSLHIPIISLEHTYPIDSWSQDQFNYFRSMTGDINVFISNDSARKWGINPYVTVNHSIDTSLFKPLPDHDREYDVLSVVNDFVNRDYCCNYSGWKRITDGLNVKLVGDTEGLSEPAKDVNELSTFYASSKIFLNTSTHSPIPTSLLEAMACGCAIVSTATCMIPEIIENGVTGFISNDESKLREYIELLLNDEELRGRLGKNARQEIVTNFSEDQFIKTWNDIFNTAYKAKAK